MAKDKKRSKALIRVHTERILHETGMLSTRDIIFKLEREYRVQTNSLHQILRPSTRIQRVKNAGIICYSLIEGNA
jgi:hypothetical protein